MPRHQAHKQAGVVVRTVGIATALVAGIGVMLAVVAAKAQDRYDPVEGSEIGVAAHAQHEPRSSP